MLTVGKSASMPPDNFLGSLVCGLLLPPSFWKTCHHATYLSIRWSCMLLWVLSYCHMCVLLYPARFGKSATMPPTYLLGSLIWYCLMCRLQCLTSSGKSATMPPTYLLGSLTCCRESYYVIALCVDCNPLQILENLPPRHLPIYKVVLCGIALCVDCYTLQVCEKHATMPPIYLLGSPFCYSHRCGLL